MKIGSVEKYINDKVSDKEPMLFIVIDPCDHPSPEAAARTAREAVEAGAAMVCLGGSIGAQGTLLERTAELIKDSVDAPLNLFPGNTSTITRHADSIYFYSLLNSRNVYWTTMAQTTGAPVIKRMGIEALPTGYIVVAPGGTVGWVADVNLVPRNKPGIAASLALAGEYLGNRLIITDVGSASEQGPVPAGIVAAVADAISVPYIVAGGIRTPEQAAEIVKAGADAIHIGTTAEKSKDVKKTIAPFVKAIRNAGKERKW
ncbi:MAG: geranylgeranylglyceryl/heptaprenylglyceryl phosphate synthase [Candidatus Diapherotrites archaeon]|nr:geranylgeranylglyceryl/heptaprenylglyceryl phosphate synthase [Candidatus Diapherotrites archaeon]